MSGSGTTSRAYRVEGMSCEHCRQAVIEEVGAIGGVEEVEVDLGSGAMQVSGSFTDREIAAAVEEAGYEVAGTSETGPAAA